MNIHVLIMAAGGSLRLGQPKQLLSYKGGSLLGHTVKECLSANIGEVIICLGAHAEKINAELNLDTFQVLVHHGWERGLGSSIAYTLAHIDSAFLDGIIIVLADQPYFSAKILEGIVETAKSQKLIICSSKYAEGQGPPVYFHKSLFSELLKCEGDEGAKALVKKYKELVQYISFPKGNIDIDTKDDLKFLER